jgi:superfamily II DNA or RNA helicase
MTHTLSSHEIALLVGSQAFSRGERYARNGHVQAQSWFGSGTQLFGEVRGTNSAPYSVTVSFTVSSAGTVARAAGVCTCPMKRNCKHVAALLIASASSSGTSSGRGTAPPVDPPVAVAFAFDDAAAEPPMVFAPDRLPRASPTGLPAWRSALEPLARPASARSSGTALALQFELLAPRRPARTAAGIQPVRQRLGVRPMVMGKRGAWIRGNLSWDNLAYARGSFNPAQLKILHALYALHAAGQRYYAYTEQWIHVDAFDNRALWEVLEEARTAGLPLVSSGAAQDPVLLSPTPAALQLDIRREPGGLALTPAVILNDRRLEPGTFGFIGDPAHGIFTWDGPSGAVRLALAPLTAPVGAEMHALATAGALDVPSADEDAFLTDYYPFLRQRLALTSTDGSFELPETARPVLALSITHQADARIELRWDWAYLSPRATPPAEAETGTGLEPSATALYRQRLRPVPGDIRYRDEAREADILLSLSGLLARFPALAAPAAPAAHPHGGRPALRDRTTLEGSAMIEFLAGAVPELEASADVVVQVSGEARDYREADEPPVISLATTDRADSHDWFDLAVTVSIDGEEIPFDDLFRALAAERELMILQSGTYFSLDRPELHQLRRLIEEARGLQESGSRGLGISRFQADLWEELQALGVVAGQAAAWRSTVEGLAAAGGADAAGIPERPLPAGVQATLRGYQQAGFDWLSFLYDHRLGGILADDMGLGKTLQAIALITHARDAAGGEGRAPFLVVAPTSVVPNWAAECARFAPGLTVATITETSRKRTTGLADASAGADVVITSYTLFRLDFDEYNAQEWAGLLLDEAQFVKNHQSKAHQCARRLSTSFKLAITGTPMENNLMEFWSLLSITAPGLFPSPGRFAEYYQKPIEADADNDRLAQLRRRIRPFMLRRTKDQVAGDLPAKQEQVLELELHPKHRKVYDTHLARERQKVLGLIEDLGANRFEIFRSLTMLRQLSLDASLYDEKYDSIPSTKLDALLELLGDTVAEGHRTLIFSQFTQYLAKARSRLDAAGISYSYLDGKTRNRAAAIADFKNGDTSVFLISLKAGGFGLNLTEADYVILLDPWWNPATEAQAVDRVHRIGQTKNVMVYRLVSRDTIEEKVMALKATKARLFDSVMTDSAAGGSGLTASDIRELLA